MFRKFTYYFATLAAVVAAACTPDFARAQIINPNPPQVAASAVAGTGLSQAGAVISVVYGTTAGTSMQGNTSAVPAWRTTNPITGSSNTGPLGMGTLTYSDTNIFGAWQTSANSFAQMILQNSNAGATASTGYLVSNDLGTATSFYGEFGMNSSGFTGSGSFNLPSATYFTSTSADLAIGTTTANAIHFVVNNGATDAMAISSGGLVTANSSITAAGALNGASLNVGTGQITAGYLSPLTGAVNRTLYGKAGDIVSVQDYGCDPTGTASSSVCFNAALATGKDVYIPPGTYKLTTLVTVSTFNQNIYGAGRASSLIQCTLTASGNCILFTGSSGNQSLRDVSVISGNTNVVKLIQVQSPQVRIVDTIMQNTASAGTVIYVDDEANPIFGFGLQLLNNTLMGAGNASTSTLVRLGLNSQTALIKNNIIENGQVAVLIQGANEASVIEDNVLENVQYGVEFITSGTMPQWAISIRKNYFEQVLTACVAFTGTGGVYSNIYVADNYATSGGGTVYFLSITDPSVSALSNGNKFENNYIQNFTAAFNLVDGVIGQTASSFKGNTLDTTSYAVGTNSVVAYQTRVVNPYFNNVLVSGAFGTKGINRMEMSAGDYQIPLRIDPHEYVDNITWKYTAVGTTSMTATLWKLATNSDTPVSVTSTSGTTSGTYTLAYGGFAAANTQYYVEIVMTLNGGTTAYVYPLSINLRQ